MISSRWKLIMMMMRMISRTTLLRHPSSLHVVSLKRPRPMWLFWPFVLWFSLWATLFKLIKINSFSFFNLGRTINVFFVNINFRNISTHHNTNSWCRHPKTLLVGKWLGLFTLYTTTTTLLLRWKLKTIVTLSYIVWFFHLCTMWRNDGVRYFFVYSFFMLDHVVFLTFETVGSGVEDTLVVDRSWPPYNLGLNIANPPLS